MLVHVPEQTLSTLWNDPGHIPDQLTTIAIDATVPTALKLTQAPNEAKKLYLAIAFLSGANPQ